MFDNLPLCLILTLPKRPCPLITRGIKSVLVKEKAQFPLTSLGSGPDLVFPASSKSNIPHTFLSVLNLPISEVKILHELLSIQGPSNHRTFWTGRDPLGSSNSSFWTCTGQHQDSQHRSDSTVQTLLELWQVWCCIQTENLDTAPFASQIVRYHIQSILQPDGNKLCLPWAVKSSWLSVETEQATHANTGGIPRTSHTVPSADNETSRKKKTLFNEI